MITTLRFDELTLECVSRAGDETWVKVQPPGLAIDAGRGTPRLQGVRDLFLTHGHLDHALGAAYLLSLQPGSVAEPLRLYCPHEIATALDAMLSAAGDLDGDAYHYQLSPLTAGDRVEVGPGMWMEAFATDHVVPSLGYHLIRRRRQLRADLAGMPPNEIARHRHAGEPIDESREERWLSCTGDTSARVFEMQPEVFESKILVIECTFLDSGQRDSAARFKHIHIQDLVEVRERFANQVLVLNHLSRRHRVSELRREVRRTLEPLVPEVYVIGESR